MKSGALPSGPWEKLFPRTLALIDEISRYGGITDPPWTLGGFRVTRASAEFSRTSCRSLI